MCIRIFGDTYDTYAIYFIHYKVWYGQMSTICDTKHKRKGKQRNEDSVVKINTVLFLLLTQYRELFLLQLAGYYCMIIRSYFKTCI